MTRIYPYRWRGGALILRLLLPVGMMVGFGLSGGWAGLIGLLLLLIFYAELYWAGLTTRRFAALSATELVIYGAFGRKRLCCPIRGTRFRYRQIQRRNSTLCFLYVETAAGRKKIDLYTCAFQGFGLLLDLNQAADTPFFDKMQQNLHPQGGMSYRAQHPHHF